MKSLRRIGRPLAARGRAQVVERAAEVAPVGEHGERRRAAALVRRADLAHVGLRRDLAGARRAALELGDQRQPGPHQRLAERARAAERADGVAQVLDRNPLLASLHVLPRCPHELLELAHVRSRVDEPAAVSRDARELARELDQALQHPLARRPSRSPPRPRSTAPPRSAPAPAGEDRRAGVQQHHVARRARLAGRAPARTTAAFSSGVPPAIALSSARGKPEILRGDEPLLGAPVGDLDHARAVGGADLVDAVVGADDQRALAPEPDERLGDRLLVAAVGDAEQLPARARRVGERTEEVEDRPHGELLAHRDHVLHRRVVAGGEHEAEADLLDAAADAVGVEVDAHPERLEQVGRARPAGGRSGCRAWRRRSRPRRRRAPRPSRC